MFALILGAIVLILFFHYLDHVSIIDLQNKNWYDWHHFYTGIIMWLVGAQLIVYGYIITGACISLIGIYLESDDLYQHAEQVTNSTYRSPVHRFYARFMYKPTRSLMYKVGLGKFFDKM
jgi:hypothetical protein